jgi:DNA polymerase III sliding clamp (beta) subunit (PCNA family)
MNREELVTKLETLKPALTNNNLVNIFSHYSFYGIQVTAYNDALAISAPCKTGAVFALSGKTLLELLKNSGAEDVDFKMEMNDVAVTCGKSRFKLPFLGAKEFLYEAPKEKPILTLKLNDKLREAIAICLTTSARDDTMRAIRGVCFKDALYSCDGDTISRVAVDGLDASGLTVSDVFCDAILAIEGDGELDIGQEWAVARIGHYTVDGRMTGTESPIDHAALIAQHADEPTFVKAPAELDAALARARVVADLESSLTLLTITKGKLKLTTSTSYGDVTDEVPLKGHPDAAAAVHASLVHRSLKVCDEIAITPSATAYRKGADVFMVVSNVGE